MDNLPLLGGNGNQDPRRKASFLSFLKAFWPICFISFGGPQAHVALLHNKFVDVPAGYHGPKMEESTFLGLYALTQALPGPGSTQLVAAFGATFGGLSGAIITFLIWHLPGFIVMSAAGLWFHGHLSGGTSVAFINTITNYAVGFISAAFGFVLLAAFKIVSKTCASDYLKMTIAVVSLYVSIFVPSSVVSWVYIVLLVAGGVAYFIYDRQNKDRNLENENNPDMDDWEARVSPTMGVVLLAIVAIISVIIAFIPSNTLGNRVLKIFWRIGLLVFGGGIIVIPLLINEFIQSSLLPTSVFLVGFGLFGIIPGPMFNLAPFLGAAVLGWKGAFYGSFGIFAPGVLLQLGFLPYWERLRRVKAVRTVLHGANGAAVGLIITGVWLLMEKVLVGSAAFALTCSAGVMSAVFKLSPVTVILSHGIIGAIIVALGFGGPYHLVQDAYQAQYWPS